jgi:hypothetical protein
MEYIYYLNQDEKQGLIRRNIFINLFLLNSVISFFLGYDLHKINLIGFIMIPILLYSILMIRMNYSFSDFLGNLLVITILFVILYNFIFILWFPFNFTNQSKNNVFKKIEIF